MKKCIILAAGLSTAASLALSSIVLIEAAIPLFELEAHTLMLADDKFIERQDPPQPDYNFRVIAKPREWISNFPNPQNRIGQIAQNTALQSRGLISAHECLQITRSRAWGAFSCGEASHLTQQSEALIEAAELIKSSSAGLAAQLRNLSTELEANQLRLTREDVVFFQNKVREAGLPEEEVALLKHLGHENNIPMFIEALQQADPDKARNLSFNLLNQADLLERMRINIDSQVQEVKNLTNVVDNDQERQRLLFEAGYLTLEDIEAGVAKVTMPQQGQLIMSQPVYKVGEKIEFSFINRGNKAITLSNPAPWAIMTEIIGGHKIFAPLSVSIITDVKPGERKSWSWNQGSNEGKQVIIGRYRVELRTLGGGKYTAVFRIEK